MKKVHTKRVLKQRRGISQILGTLVVLAIVSSLGSVILFNGMDNINAFTYDLSFHEKSKNQKYQEDMIFENIRFEPFSDDMIIDLANVGTVDITISTITILNINTQEIITAWIQINEIIPRGDHLPIVLDVSNENDIVLDPNDLTIDTWEEIPEDSPKFKISISTLRGNFFTTIATPINT